MPQHAAQACPALPSRYLRPYWSPYLRTGCAGIGNLIISGFSNLHAQRRGGPSEAGKDIPQSADLQ